MTLNTLTSTDCERRSSSLSVPKPISPPAPTRATPGGGRSNAPLTEADLFDDSDILEPLSPIINQPQDQGHIGVQKSFSVEHGKRGDDLV